MATAHLMRNKKLTRLKLETKAANASRQVANN